MSPSLFSLLKRSGSPSSPLTKQCTLGFIVVVKLYACQNLLTSRINSDRLTRRRGGKDREKRC
jgi:hypothetical protein